MTTDTPRTDACPHCGAKQSPHITTVDEYECETFISKGGGNTKRSELCRERERHQDALLRYSEELAASKAEVERLKELVNESIVEKSNLSIAIVNCQADLRRAIDVARMLPVIPIPAISSRDITDTLYAELNQLEATLNPATTK